MKNPIAEANKLLAKLKDKAKKNPKVFGENYGEKELRNFEDKMNAAGVSYTEKAAAMSVLYSIWDFSPYE